MTYTPKEIPEEINVTPVHPLVNFGHLLATVAIASVAIYAGLGFAAVGLVSQLSPKTEQKIGQALLLAAAPPPLILEDEPTTQYLNQLLTSLKPSALQSRPPLTIHLVDEPAVNAAILPGGHVLVMTGLLEAVESENELAFVLAHELGHFAARDPLRALGRSLVFLSLASALGLGSSGSNGASALVAMTGNLNELHYSRQQESAADHYALSLIVQKYQHGGHSLDLFERLQAQETELGPLVYQPELLSTHPLTQNRIDNLKQLAREQGWSLDGTAAPLPEGLACPNFDCDV